MSPCGPKARASRCRSVAVVPLDVDARHRRNGRGVGPEPRDGPGEMHQISAFGRPERRADPDGRAGIFHRADESFGRLTESGLQIRQRPAAWETSNPAPPASLPGRRRNCQAAFSRWPLHRVGPAELVRLGGRGLILGSLRFQPRMPVRLRCSNGRRRNAGRRAGRSRNLKLRPTARSERELCAQELNAVREEKASPSGVAGARSGDIIEYRADHLGQCGSFGGLLRDARPSTLRRRTRPGLPGFFSRTSSPPNAPSHGSTLRARAASRA